MIYQHQWRSPVGMLQMFMQDDQLSGVYFPNHVPAPRVNDGAQAPDRFVHVIEQLGEYFDGERTVFDIPVCFQGTGFQREVWACLRRIPFGQTTSYHAIADQIGRSKAVRAVGGAVARNPLSVIVPCHRVVGLRGALTGFAGGLDRKATLLRLEQSDRVTVSGLSKSQIPTEAA